MADKRIKDITNTATESDIASLLDYVNDRYYTPHD